MYVSSNKSKNEIYVTNKIVSYRMFTRGHPNPTVKEAGSYVRIYIYKVFPF